MKTAGVLALATLFSAASAAAQAPPPLGASVVVTKTYVVGPGKTRKTIFTYTVITQGNVNDVWASLHLDNLSTPAPNPMHPPHHPLVDEPGWDSRTGYNPSLYAGWQLSGGGSFEGSNTFEIVFDYIVKDDTLGNPTAKLDYFDNGNRKLIPVAMFSGFDSNGVGIPYQSIMTMVPEPASWTMMIFGFGLVGAVTRGRIGRHIGTSEGVSAS